jgi:hypothetical protein
MNEKAKMFGRFSTWINSSYRNHKGSDGASRVFIENIDQDMQERRRVHTLLSSILQTCSLSVSKQVLSGFSLKSILISMPCVQGVFSNGGA